MLSEWSAIAILFALGVVFDRVVLVLIQARHDRYVTILLLTFCNNVMIFLVMFFVYMVHGFAVHHEFGIGWLDWVTLVEGVLAAYIPVSIGFVWRVITKREM